MKNFMVINLQELGFLKNDLFKPWAQVLNYVLNWVFFWEGMGGGIWSPPTKNNGQI